LKCFFLRPAWYDLDQQKLAIVKSMNTPIVIPPTVIVEGADVPTTLLEVVARGGGVGHVSEDAQLYVGRAVGDG